MMVWVKRFVSASTEYIEKERNGKEIANPVRAGFDQFLVQPHLEFCRAIKLKPISKTVTPPT